MRKYLLVLTACTMGFLGGINGQENCFPYVMEPCEGDPFAYECVKITTELSAATGGESSLIEQQFCYKSESPLFDEVILACEKGYINLDQLEEGKVFGELVFDVSLSDFATECDAGDRAFLKAELSVAEVVKESADVRLTIEEVSDPMVSCLLTYDPTDAAHNSGLLMEGYIGNLEKGGFELRLSLAELSEGAENPGLEYGDIDSLGSAVPFFFRPVNVDNLFILPASGGELSFITTLIAPLGDSREFVQSFDIEPGAGGARFRRGDVNDDGAMDIADAINLLNHLFVGDPAPSCQDAADANDDGKLDISDAIRMLGFLFAGEGPLPEPFGSCGTDQSEDELPPCEYTSCSAARL